MRDLGPGEDGPQRVHHGDAQRVAQADARVLLAVGHGAERGAAHFQLNCNIYYLFRQVLQFDDLL